MADRHDVLLLQLAQACGSIDNILDAFIGFLSRKTDFFVIQTEDLKHMGFPPGIAEKMLLQTFRKYQKQVVQPAPPKKQNDAVKESPKTSTQPPKTEVTKSTNKDKSAPANKPTAETTTTNTTTTSTNTATTSTTTTSTTTTSTTTNPDIIPPKDLTNGISPYNGGITDRYRWSQTLTEVTVQIPVPKGTVAKQLNVKIEKQRLVVGVKGQTVVVEGELDYPCVPADSVWTLEDNQSVILTLEKPEECFWKTVIKGDAEIDTTKVDSTKNITDYDQETQAEIRRLMFDQDQKRKGLKTSEELRNEEMLRKAWDAEGSPFKGQPFDMSKINFSGGGGGGMLPPEVMPPGAAE